MAIYTQSPTELPELPTCTVKGHSHNLLYLETVEQDGTGSRAYRLECPTGKYRFFYIPSVWEQHHTMARQSEPRWGWPS